MKIVLKILKVLAYLLLVIFILILASFAVVHFSTKASDDRAWNTDQEILPWADIDGSAISIHNIRNFSYTSTTSYIPNYYDKTFDLDALKKVWYVVEPFSGIPGSAHTFLSFEFENDQFVSISVEIRKEKGELFHPIKGLFNQYELMYVIADERDAIKLRSNYRKDLVYVYPIKTTKEKSQQLFVDMIQRTNELKNNPEFYNTLTNTCTTNIVQHINKIREDKVSMLDLQVLFPAGSDQLAHDLGLLDTDLSLEDAREKFFINDKAEKYADSEDFSRRIRE